MQIEVVTFGMPAAPSEWQAAMLLPETDLPEMSAAEAADVERLGLNKLRHRRGMALRRIAQHRETTQALELSLCLQRLADKMDRSFEIVRVLRTSLPVGWSVRLMRREPASSTDLLIAQPVVDQLLAGTASSQDLDSLAHQIALQLDLVLQARRAS